MLMKVATTSVKMINVLLNETIHLKSHQSKVVQTVLEEKMVMITVDFMISPNETALAERDCDVLETVISGSVNKITIPLNNWGGMPVVMKKGSKIGVLEEMISVDKTVDIWTKQSPEIIRICQTNIVSKSQCQELGGQLQIANACDKKERLKVKELLLQYHDILHCVMKS